MYPYPCRAQTSQVKRAKAAEKLQPLPKSIPPPPPTSFLLLRPIKAFLSLLPNLTFHLSSFSKRPCKPPSLRIRHAPGLHCIPNHNLLPVVALDRIPRYPQPPQLLIALFRHKIHFG